MAAEVDDMQQVLHGIADDIREADHRIAALQSFLDHVETHTDTGCFTAEECAATREHIALEVHARAQKVEMLREKVEVYEDQVLALHRTLDVRKRVLDEHPGSLQHAPGLLSLFVERHAQLTADLEAAREFLIQ